MNTTSPIVRISLYGSSRPLSSAMLKSFILLPALAVAMVSGADASSKTWDPGLTPGAGSNGSGTWTNGSGATWSTGAADTTFATTDDAIVGVAGGSGTYTIGINSAGVTANSLTLNNAGTGTYVFGTTGALGTLTLSSATTALTVNNNTIFNTAVNLSGTGTVAFNTGSTSLTYNAGGALGAGLGGTSAATATESINTGAYTVGGSGEAFNIGNAGTLGTDPGLTTPTSGFIINTGATLTTGASFATGQGANGLTTINGGTINNSIGGYIIVGRSATGSSLGRVVLDSGTVTGLSVLINHQGGATATGGGEFDINGGILTETGQIAVGSSTAGGNAILNIAGGTATFSTINFGSIAGQAISTGGSSTLNLSGGTLYVGPGGINNVATGTATYAINLSGGTLGAAGDWSTPLNIALSGTTTIQAADSSAVAHNISLGGNLTGTGAITKTGAGTLKLSGSNAGTLGALAVNGGAVQFANENSFYGGSSITSTAAAKVSAASGGTVALNVGGTGEFTSSDVATLAANGTFASGSAIGLDTTDASGSFNLSNGLAGSFGLTKQGAGTLAVTGANTYTGATTVNGGTLDIGGGGATGSINSSSALVLNNGTLSLTETGGASQTFAGATFGGNSSIQTVAGDTLALGALTRSGNGLIDFSSTGTITTTTANDAGGILGSYATVGGAGWAANNGSGVIVPYAAYTQTSTALNVPANYTNNNIDVNSSQAPTGAITPNTLRFNTGAAETLTLSAVSSLTDGGILVTPNVGAHLSTITGSTIEGSASGNLTVDQNNTSGGLTIASIIANNVGATGLVKNGAGTLTLSGVNTFTGSTVLNAGVLSLVSANALNTAALNGGITFLGGTLQYNGSTTDYSNTIKNSTSAISIDINGKSVTWASVLAASNTGGLTLTDTSAGGAGVLTLSNTTNLFSGPININSGILNLGNTTAFGNAGAINVATGGALQLSPNRTLYGPLITINGSGPSGNGAIETTNGPIYEGNIALGSNATIGADSGSIFGLQSTTVTNNGFALTFTGAGTITSTANITGSGSLTKTGTGTVNLNDTSLYSGGTTIKAGVLAAGAAGALGGGAVTLGDTTGSANASLNLGVSSTFSNPLTVASGSSGNTLALQFTAGNPIYSGAITLANNLAINVVTTGNINSITGGITGAGNVTINNAGTSQSTTISSGALNFNGGLTNTGAGTVATTISAPIGSLVTGITENGASPLVLSGSNTFTGPITVTSGIVKIANANGMSTSSGVTVAGTGAALQVGSINATLTGTTPITLNGTGVSSNGALENVINNQTLAGLVTLGSNTSIGSDSGILTLSNTGTITGSGDNLTLVGPGNVTIASIIGTGAGSVIGNATGTDTLSGVNTYSGGTTVNSGTLVLGNAGAAGSGTITLGNTTGSATATINEAYGTGAVSNALTVASGTTGTLTLASTAGNNTFSGAITLGTSGSQNLTIASSSGGVNVWSGGITGSGNLTINATNGGTETFSTGALNFAGTITNNGAGAAPTTISSAIGSSVTGITENSSTSTLTLSGVNTGYAGSVTDTLGTIKMGGASALNASNTVLLNAASATTATFDLNANSETIAGLNSSGTGTDVVTNSSAAGARILTLGGSGTYSYGGTITGTSNLALTMAGSGTQTLTGANTYTGTTTLAGGVLNAGVADTGSGTTATAGALGTGASTITFTGGTLQYSSASASTDYSGRIKSSTGAIKVDTNSQNVTYATALASTNTGGLTKLGAGTLTLTGANAYTGATTVSGGTLQIGNGTTGSIGSASAVSVAASSTLGINLVTAGTFSNTIADNGTVAGTETGVVANTLSGVITGTGGFSQTGTGTTTLTGSNAYTGATSITAGTVVANNAGAAGSTGALGQNSAVTMGTTAGTLTLGANLQIGSLAGGGTGGNVGLSTFTLTDGGNNTNTTYAGVISSGTGGGLTKIGTGTQILSGANTYTGATTVNAGTLQVGNGTAGSISSSSALTLGGGTLSILGKTSGTTAQTIASLTATANTGSTILLTPNGGTSTTLTVTTGSAATGTSSINFNYAAGTTNGATVGNDIVVWAPTGVTAGVLIGGGYTVTDAGGSGFATINASNDVVRNTTSTALPVSVGSSSTNYNVNSSFSTSSTTTPGSLVEALSGNVAANTVTVDTTGLASGANLALGTNALTLTGNGGLLFTGANPYAITGTGGIKFAAGGTTIFLDNYDTNTVTISAPILNNGGANAVSIDGTGTTALGGANTYSGGTAINGGTVNLTGTLASAATVNSGATFNIGSGGKITGGGVILNNGAGYSENAAGVISGSSVFTVSTGNTGTYTVAGANTYTGATTINGGTVNIGGASVFGVSGPLGNTSNTALANVAGTTLNLNGFDLVIGDLTGGGTLGGNVNLGANTLTLNNGGGTFSGIISGSGSVVKTNVTNSAEAFAGANTYSGGTTVKAGLLEAENNTAFGTGGVTLGDSTGSLNAEVVILNTIVLNNPLTVAAGSSGNTLSLAFQSQTNSFTGAVTLANNLTIFNNGSGNLQTMSGGITGTGNLTIGAGATSGTGSAINFTTNPINFNGSILNNEGAAGSTASIFSAPIGPLVTGVTENSATSKLVLAAANTYTSPTTITSGTLMLGGAGVTQTPTAAGSISTSSVISGSGTFAINRTNAVAQGVDFSGAALGGALSFSQIGTGTTTLTAANTYTGVTTISGGTLQLGDGTSGDDGSIAGASIVDGTALVYDSFGSTAYTGVISGAGTVAMSGPGTVTLSGSNTYAGTTTLNSGIVNVNAADVASTSGALGNGGAITFKGGTLQYGAAAATSDYSTRIVSSTSAINVDTNGQNVAYNGALAASNTGGLTKQGVGTLTLGSAANAYTGTTTIAGGTLAFSVAGDLNATSPSALSFTGGTLELTANNVSLSQLATIAAGTTATFQVDGSANLTLAGGVAETTTSGALTKTGTGTLTFTAANAYTGLTTINAGVIDYQNTTAFSTGDIAVNAGGTARVEDLIATGTPTITISGSGATGAQGALESSGPTGNLFMCALVLGADATISSDSSGSFFELAGNTITGNHTLAVAGAGMTEIDDNITTGSGGVTMNGSNLLLLTGANTYTGPTTVNSGTLQAGGPTVAGVSGAFGVNSAVTVANVSGATLDLNGNDTQIGSLAGGGSTGGSVLLGSNTLTTGADNTSTAFGGVIGGINGKLVKIGTGAQTLTGINTYSGGTTISAGRLYVNGGTSGVSSGIGSGAVLVNGGTLAGSGNVATGTVTVTGGGIASGAVQTGSTVSGTGLTITNTSVALSSATLTFDLGSGTTAGSGYHTFSTPNTNTTFLTLAGSTSINFAGTDSVALVDLTNGGLTALRLGTPYLLASAGSNADYLNLVIVTGTGPSATYSLSQNDGSGINGYVLGVYTGTGTLGSSASYTPITINQYGPDGVTPLSGSNIYAAPALYLNNGDLEVVPEPGTWALMLGGLGALLVVQKLRRHRNS